MKTAVEWLFEQLDVVDSSISYEYFKQAKEMEKQHIVDAHLKGQKEDVGFINEAKQEAEQYYKETFKPE
jgi:hypothetical protein